MTEIIEPTTLFNHIQFNDQGLVPAIAQQHDTGEVLMMAWMSKESIEETLFTRRVCYWSRQRKTLWRKGETSGHHQYLVEMKLDCDGDTLLLMVDQHGPACHTGTPNCFFRKIDIPVAYNPYLPSNEYKFIVDFNLYSRHDRIP